MLFLHVSDTAQLEKRTFCYYGAVTRGKLQRCQTLTMRNVKQATPPRAAAFAGDNPAFRPAIITTAPAIAAVAYTSL